MSIDRRLAAGLVFALGLFATLTPAVATVCGERGKMVKVLVDKYQESPLGLGVVSERGVVELYTSAAGTWSILLTTPDGTTCVIAAGSDWQDIKQPAGETDS